MKEIATFFLYTGISTLLFLIVLLVTRLKEKPTNKILIVILSCLLLLFLTYGISYFKNDYLSSTISYFGILSYYLLGPSILFYINSIYSSTFKAFQFFKNSIPFIVVILVYTITFFFSTKETQEINNSTLLLIGSILIILGIFYFFFFLILCYKSIKKIRIQIKDNYASLKDIDLKWLSIWVKGFLLFILIDFFSAIFILYYPVIEDIIFINLIYLTLLIFYIGYYGLNQPKIFLLPTTIEPQKSNAIIKSQIQSTITLDCDSLEVQKIKVTLENLFFEKQIFKNQQLSLKELALLLNISDKKLSTILNTCLHSNFYEYVNRKRIVHFKKLIKKEGSEKLTLLAIAYDAGFNSKATFNRVFKQLEGVTPLQFKNSLNK